MKKITISSYHIILIGLLLTTNFYCQDNREGTSMEDIIQLPTPKYESRTERYVNMEVGHVGQNIYLQAVSLGLGTVMIGAFNDEALKKALELPENEHPLALYPLGKI